MTNETRNRIRAYMEELPHMKEKVFGALLMLVVAAVVAVSTSYAWVTLSQAPEVSEITTTLAANGALEIALSKPDGTQPGEYDVDESDTEDKNVTTTNLWWGNLVNLSDASYGIDKLDLRPAVLETASLNTNPLSGALYGEDGRIIRQNSAYTYTVYNGNEFVASGKYGVRAISSYIIDASSSAQQTALDMAQAVTDARSKVDKQYNEGVVDNFDTLGAVITRVAQDRVNQSDYAYDPNATDSNLAMYLPSVRDFYVELEKAMALQKDVYVALANLQRYLWSTAGEDREYVPLTWADLEASHRIYNVGSSGTSTNGVVALTGLSQFVTDYNSLCSDLTWLQEYVTLYRADRENVKFYWSHHDTELTNGPTFGTIINRLIDYTKMKVEYQGEEYTLSGIQSIAMDLVLSPQDSYNVYIYTGIIKRFEEAALDGARMNGRAQCTISIKASYMDATKELVVNGKAHTKASGASYIASDFAVYQNQAVGSTTKLAEDTYGLVVDLWVRTNAEETCLTLEGAIATDENYGTLQYQGSNRIWGEITGTSLTTNHTTQGGGSCYTYYTDSPEDMARSLDVLKAMKVAFVSSSGTLLATAEMDTGNYLAVNGRVTVPLVLSDLSGITYTYMDNDIERTGRAITTLRTDEAVRITAIIYLDGEYLTNNQVLAAAKIQGSLNIQFGSSTNLLSVADDSHELRGAKRTVTATASKTELNFDDKLAGSTLSSEITVSILDEGGGSPPNQVTAFFVREINSMQGTREPTMTFTRLDDGTWTTKYEFTSPGIYHLRHVRLDGVDYALEEPVKVVITGYNISETGWSLGDQARDVTVRTSESSYEVDVWAVFGTSDTNKMPYTMEMRFEREDGNTVNVPLKYDSGGKWVGTALFDASGTYTMKYVVYTIQGETIGRYKELEDQRKLNLALGMYVNIVDPSGIQDVEEMFTEEDYAANPTVYNKEVQVRVYDNAGNAIGNLNNLVLFYTRGGTSTLDANLTWVEDGTGGYYSGNLPIAAPGRYQFAYVTMGDSTLTRSTGSPTYLLRSPYTPEYNEDNSVNRANEKGTGIQFVPMTMDAVIDGLAIDNSASADITVVLYNAQANAYFERTNTSSDAGQMTYNGSENDADSYWTISLPTYYTQDTDGDGVMDSGPSQEGDWSVAAVLLSGCYKNDEPRTDENPIVWGALSEDGVVDPISRTWLDANGWTAEEYCDFNALSTTVSSSVTVTMDPGESTTLGGDNIPFMTMFGVEDLDLSVTVTNGAQPIPSGKIKSVSLDITYQPGSATVEEHGYQVKTGMNTDYDLVLKYDTAGEVDRYIVDKEKTTQKYWQYVGDYKVNKLIVEFNNGNKVEYTPGSAGVPEKYTVKTAGPSAAAIAVNLVQDSTLTTDGRSAQVLGKTGNTVTGVFLEQQDLTADIHATVSLSANIDVNGDGLYNSADTAVTEKVDVANLLGDVTLKLTYEDGSQANGGYSWSGTSQYEEITCSMNGANNIYRPTSTPMLAGTYTGVVTVNLVEGEPIEKELPYEIWVYSKQPTLKVTEVSPGVDESFQVDTNDDESIYVENAVPTNVQNYVSSTGNLANVYIKFTEKSSVAQGQDGEIEILTVLYTLPEATLKLSNVDGAGFKTATAVVNNEANSSITNVFSFLPTDLEDTQFIGGKEGKTAQYSDAGLCDGESVSVPYDIQYNAGVQEITSITMTDDKDHVYTVSLAEPLTIRQENSAPPSITYVAVSGYNTFDPVISESGEALEVTLPEAEDFGTQDSQETKFTDGTGWGEPVSDTVTKRYIYVATVGDVHTNTVGNQCTGTKNYKYYDFVYYPYERHQYVYKQTSSTQFYKVTNRLLGWKIGDTVYEPGQTIVIDSVVTATPIIGAPESEWELLREEVVTTVHTTIRDILAVSESNLPTSQGDDETHTSEVEAKKDHAIPVGYEAYSWYNTSDHFDSSLVIHEETQYGSDYQE